MVGVASEKLDTTKVNVSLNQINKKDLLKECSVRD